MKITQLETFVAVAEELHFRRAAERLYTQPSSVSTQISQLEAEYGTPLFTRNSRNVALTPAGQTLLEKARNVLASVNELEQTARSISQPDHLELTVGVLDEGMAELAPVVNESYAARYPNASLTIDALNYDQFDSALADGDVDVLISLIVDDAGPDLVVKRLFSESRSVVLPLSHPLASRSEVRSTELIDQPFVRVDGLDDDLHRFFVLGDQRDPAESPDVPVPATHMHNLLSHIARGRGIITVTRGNERFYPRPDIAYVPVPDLEPGTFGAVYRRDEQRPHVLAYIEECVNAVRNSLDLIPTATDATRDAP